MPDHTPGPWRVAGRGNSKQQLPILASDNTEIAVITHGHLADAYLIVAVHDLLLALEELLADVEAITTLEPGDVGLRQLRRAHAAIDKAKGVS